MGLPAQWEEVTSGRWKHLIQWSNMITMGCWRCRLWTLSYFIQVPGLAIKSGWRVIHKAINEWSDHVSSQFMLQKKQCCYVPFRTLVHIQNMFRINHLEPYLAIFHNRQLTHILRSAGTNNCHHPTFDGLPTSQAKAHNWHGHHRWEAPNWRGTRHPLVGGMVN